MPIEYLGEYITLAHVSSAIGMLPQSFNIRLKLFVEFEFLGGEKALQIYSYPVEKEMASHTYIPTFIGTSNPVPSIYPYVFTPTYQDFLEIGSTYFEGPTHGFEESQIIFAWSSIKIDGDLTAAPGKKIEIVAPNITLTDGATIGSDILLRSSFAPFPSYEPAEEFSSAELGSYCSSDTYKARSASYTITEEESVFLAARAEEEARQEQTSRQTISLRTFPNPLEDFGTLEFVLPADMPVSAYLSDMHGQRLQELVSPRDLPAGRHLFDLTLVNLPPGMYLLTLQTPEGPQTVKLVHL